MYHPRLSPFPYTESLLRNLGRGLLPAIRSPASKLQKQWCVQLVVQRATGIVFWLQLVFVTAIGSMVAAAVAVVGARGRLVA